MKEASNRPTNLHSSCKSEKGSRRMLHRIGFSHWVLPHRTSAYEEVQLSGAAQFNAMVMIYVLVGSYDEYMRHYEGHGIELPPRSWSDAPEPGARTHLKQHASRTKYRSCEGAQVGHDSSLFDQQSSDNNNIYITNMNSTSFLPILLILCGCIGKSLYV
jgi:hypothetical protein